MADIATVTVTNSASTALRISGVTITGHECGQIPLADGSYRVRLHIAEPYFGATGGGAGGTGKRVFDVNFEEGAKEIVGLDLNAMVPPMTAYIDTRTVTVIVGNLDIDFAATTNFPSVSAIEIIPN